MPLFWGIARKPTRVAVAPILVAMVALLSLREMGGSSKVLKPEPRTALRYTVDSKCELAAHNLTMDSSTGGFGVPPWSLLVGEVSVGFRGPGTCRLSGFGLGG